MKKQSYEFCKYERFINTAASRIIALIYFLTGLYMLLGDQNAPVAITFFCAAGILELLSLLHFSESIRTIAIYVCGVLAIGLTPMFMPYTDMPKLFEACLSLTITGMFYIGWFPIACAFAADLAVFIPYASVFSETDLILLAGFLAMLSIFVTLIKDFITSYIVNSLSQRKALYHSSYHDPLTSLPNRLLFHDRLNQAIFQASRTGMLVGVIFLDLDSFKNINDLNGHLTGDRLLVEVSRRLQGEMRESDTLARFGGDEFVILIPCMEDASLISVIARRLEEAFAYPFFVNGECYSLSVTIGWAVYPHDGTNDEALLWKADMNMLATKRQKNNAATPISTARKVRVPQNRHN